jgi:hypothetical protein
MFREGGRCQGHEFSTRSGNGAVEVVLGSEFGEESGSEQVLLFLGESGGCVESLLEQGRHGITSLSVL